MNNLTNIILTKVTNLAQTSGVIANAADKLLSHILPKDDVAARCWTYLCSFCVRGQRSCRTCCVGSVSGCYTTYKRC